MPARKAAVPRITLHTNSAEIAIRPTSVNALQQAAMQWSHIVRNRKRWAPGTTSVTQQSERAREVLTKTLGLSEADRNTIAESTSVEVSMPFGSEQEQWEARVLPWEYLLTAGTTDLRNAPLTVLRRLELKGRRPQLPAKPAVLYVESAPGRIKEVYDFAEEEELVLANTGAKKFVKLTSPTRAEFKAALTKVKPDIVHLAGVDTHQGFTLLKDDRAPDAHDGYLLAGPGATVDPVDAESLAKIIAAAPPALVVCNLWNSAARVSAMLVAVGGAGAALGFQDSFDDGLAQLMLGSFYAALSTEVLEEAFATGWKALRSHSTRLRGTGIALWQGGAPRRTTRRAVAARVRPEEEKVLAPSSWPAERLHELFSVSVEPLPEINYAQLHNNRDLFSAFLIKLLQPGRVEGVAVRVELNVGDVPYPYRESFSITRPGLDVRSRARLPLVSALQRDVDEVMRTSLFVEIRWGDHVVFSQTFRTSLTPIDQWPDTDRDRLFLPSFVFPRNAALDKVLVPASRYVRMLRDDPTAGFDGYQCLVDSDLDDPALDVDNQVQAVWYAIVQNTPITYFNPPATYPPSSTWQRVRSPSETILQGRGTCIDLALLMCACLEVLEIYPVMFLLDDHAFPGYWRTDAAHEAFHERIQGMASEKQGGEPGAAALDGSDQGWHFPKRYFEEIKKEIDAYRLIPLETVGLTDMSGFETSMDDALAYFEKKSRFDSMIDINKARENGVTPLPISARVK